MDYMSEIGRWRRACLGACTGAKRYNHIGFVEVGPYMLALPQRKVDRIIVFQAPILKGP